MFYSQFILAKKGPLGTIWIAAHLERKLRKNQVADTDIGVSVDSILFPDVPIALRLSSHLLLGVVRIYSRKVNYLFDDCSEALLKIKQAFRSTAVDLAPEESTAPYHSITLPETFDLDDFELPDNDMFQGNYVDHHVSTREQITLQDTMEGVVFSTSQFGLDERFGDGDASQIGLDIDEDLFLQNVAARGNDRDPDAYPLTPAPPMTPGEKDGMFEGVPGTSATMQDDGVDDQEQIEYPAANIEAHEHIQSPFTPAVECPSPLDVQETVACDGPMGSKDHELRESEAVECTESGNRTSDAHEMVHHSEENGYLSGDVEMEQPKYQIHSASVEGTRANMPEDNGLSTPSSVMVEDAKALPLVPECPNGHISAGDGSDMHNNNEQGANLVDRTDAESPSCSQVTTELEDSGRRTSSADVEFQNNMGESCSPSNKISSKVVMPESPDRPEVVNVEAQTFREPKETDTLNNSTHEHIPSADFPELRACNTLKQTGEVSQPTDAVELESEKRHLSEPSLCGETPDDCRRLGDEIDNAPSCDNQLANVEGSAASNFPAPEKLLSVSEGLFSKPNDLLLESTPEKEGLGDDDGGAGDNLMSGKKRSFTESTLTIHSLNSGESFSMNKSRRTAESIPGDDDLLSSILVGRKSVFKMKPTPPASEITSTKRRYAPRASALKRKVLMDDMMVLHGDIIRQQLTNTEDIRRLRKKAPCTRPEISMIQRQFLEEEIFSEPIFTGTSTQLVSLHSEIFDLSRIKVTENDQDDAPVELAKDKESSDVAISYMETQIDDGCIQKENAEISDVRSQQETLKEDAEMEVDPKNIGVSGLADHDVQGLEFSLPNDPVSNDFAENVPADILQPNIVDKNNDADTSGQMDVPCMSPPRFDTEPAEGTSLADTHIEGVDAIEVVENEAEVRIDVDEDNGNVQASFETASLEIGGCDNMTLGIGNQSVEEIENNNLSVMHPNEVDALGLGCSEKDLTSISMLGEGAIADSTFPFEHDMNGVNIHLDKGVEDSKEADLPSAANADITAESSAIEFLGDFEDGTIGNDTEFLNVDDDEVAEDDEDYMPGAEDTRPPENSGWSSRTRAVSNYLQTLFEKEPQHGRRVLAMDNLLTGKTRKEASRMFFETLVLKTKDYIQVEQAKPFDNINIKPRIKLMKSDF